MAIAVGTTTTFGNSMVVAAAIAIHNIPEGICTSAPYYYASGKRLKSFVMSSLSALPIVAGFLVVRFWLLDIRPLAMSILVGATAGLMMMPVARNGKNGRMTMFFFMLGIIADMLLELML